MVLFLSSPRVPVYRIMVHAQHAISSSRVVLDSGRRKTRKSGAATVEGTLRYVLHNHLRTLTTLTVVVAGHPQYQV